MLSLTKKALEEFDNAHEFERMCADILVATGNTEVVPIAPRGGPDGGKDITFLAPDGTTGLACVTLRKDIDQKFTEDFNKRTKGEYGKYILYCSAYLTAQQKLKFAKYCIDSLESEFLPQDIEALRALLDNTLVAIRRRYLYLDDQEASRRQRVLAGLHREYVLSNDNISPALLAGTEPLPQDWVKRRLFELSEHWS